MRAINNLHEAGVEIVSCNYMVNGINNDRWDRLLDSPRQSQEDCFLSFQPVSFTGRDEEITPHAPSATAYTLFAPRA